MSLSCHHHVRCVGTKIGKQSSSGKVVEEIPLEGGMGRRQRMKSLLPTLYRQTKKATQPFLSLYYIQSLKIEVSIS